jgi:hypothetical protein
VAERHPTVNLFHFPLSKHRVTIQGTIQFVRGCRGASIPEAS